ncbi:hypothetical protein SAMN05443432_11433 [Roseovarius litoreus]|uniref:Uncharacterized protein n=1 Tax=Roseovarius litoreus TaxID=1155722 RepID=A0A1M7LA71_9RHOB|nr:hypothetical protein SAMN05443432_11433 [Roseovarius litoreus]
MRFASAQWAGVNGGAATGLVLSEMEGWAQAL